MRLLLVEDNARLALHVVAGLKNAGLAADAVGSADEAAGALRAQAYDAIILDLGLPDRDGLVFLREIRALNPHVPVLILTARDSLQDRIGGLDGGADDYLVKPFAIEELAARIRALLRRPGQSLGTLLEAGNVAYHAESRDVTVAGMTQRLTRRELDLLEQLLRASGQVLTKEKIESRLYSYGETGSANSIEVLVHRLRKKLEKAGADIEIHTLRGVGYMMSGTQAGS